MSQISISTPEGFAAFMAEKLREDREYAESRMRGTCRITRPGPWVSDGAGGGSHVPTTVYEGRYYARYPGLAFEQNTEVAGGTAVVSRLVVRIPFGPICRPGDQVEVLTDPDNPQMVGVRLSVASVDDASQNTAQRLICNDFQGGVYTGAGENLPEEGP